MNLSLRVLLIPVASLICLCGCSRSLPLISHAHVGHGLTAWRDTPGEQGLFVVAEKETHIALQAAENATHPGLSANQVRIHLSNVVHALDPIKRERGDGLGYGAVRALEGSMDHLIYASQSDDASANLIAMVNSFSVGAESVIARMRLATEVALLAEQVDTHERGALAGKLHQILLMAVDGEHGNGDDRTHPKAQVYGLKQLRRTLSEGLRREDPPYHPIGRRFLLGLVRLPNGEWAYRFDTSDPDIDKNSYSFEDY
jgi:hypothetical protein